MHRCGTALGYMHRCGTALGYMHRCGTVVYIDVGMHRCGTVVYIDVGMHRCGTVVHPTFTLLFRLVCCTGLLGKCLGDSALPCPSWEEPETYGNRTTNDPPAATPMVLQDESDVPGMLIDVDDLD